MPATDDANSIVDLSGLDHNLKAHIAWITELTGAEMPRLPGAPGPSTNDYSATSNAHIESTQMQSGPIPPMPGAWPEEHRAHEESDNNQFALAVDALAILENKIKLDKAREVNTGLAASLFNSVRDYRRGRRGNDRSHSNADLMSSITDEVAMQWWQAQGLTEKEVREFRKGAFYAGLIDPWGTFLTSALSYIAVPAIGYTTGSPWASFGAGLAFSIATPALNAIQQSGVVELCDQARERVAHSISLNKDMIHDKHWPKDLASAVATAAENFAEKGAALTRSLDTLLAAHNRTVPPAGHLASEALTKQRLLELLQYAREDDRKELEGLLRAFQESERTMEALQRELFMTEASRERQRIGNAWQIIPRALRSPASTLVGLGRGRDANEMAAVMTTRMNNAVSRVSQFSAGTSVAIQAALSLLIFGGNMLAAAVDIRNQHEYNNIMNLVYGDCFNDAGRLKEKSGEAYTPDDVDPEKLRSFVLSPEQALVKRMIGIITSKISDIERRIENVTDKAKLSQPRAAEEGSEYPASIEADIQVMRDTVAALNRERELLQSAELRQLPPDSMSAGLLRGSLDNFVSSFMRQGLIAKYRKKGEVSSQTAQRIGQTFHLLFLGSGPAALVGTLGNAIAGGADHTPTKQILGLAAAGLIMGGIGAYFHSAAVDIKNNRRDNAGGENEITFSTQVIRGMFAAPIAVSGAKQVHSANDSVTKALDRMQLAGDIALKLHGALEHFRPSSEHAN